MSYISAPARPVEFALAYWQGTPQGYLSPIIYSAPAHGVVTEADAHFAAWVATGNLPIAWPWDETGTVTVAALDAVLANCGLPASGLAPATPAQLFGYANAKCSALRATPRSYDLGGTPDVSIKADATADTIALVSGLADWGAANPTATQDWIDDFGAVTSITGAQAVALKAAGLAYIQSLYAALGTVCAGVRAGTIATTAQIDAAAWPSLS